MGLLKDIIYATVAITVPVAGIVLVGLLADSDDPEV